jgi:Domain of unknown function (DUF4430)
VFRFLPSLRGDPRASHSLEGVERGERRRPGPPFRAVSKWTPLTPLIAAVVVALVVVPAASALEVHVRIEGKTRTIFGSTAPLVDVTSVGANALPESALDALAAAAALGEFYYHVAVTSFGPYVDQIGPYAASGQTGWVYKVNGVSPPVGANDARLKEGDTVLWYWAQFGSVGGPKTLVLSRVGKTNCYRVRAQDDSGVLTPALGAVLHVGKRTVQTQGATQAGVGCVGRHRGLLVRATLDGAVRSNALP